MKDYRYVKGLAELAQELRKDGRDVIVPFDLGSPSGRCNYCEAVIRWKFVFAKPEESLALAREAWEDPSAGHAYWGVGSECVDKICRYLYMSAEATEKAIKFFEKYQELVKLAEVDPNKAIELQKFVQKLLEVKELKKKRIEVKQRRFKEFENKLRFISKRRLWLNDWERSFISDCLLNKELTEKMAEIVMRTHEKVKEISDEEVERQKEAFHKALFVLNNGEYRVWWQAYKAIRDMYRREKPLTDKQMTLIERWHKVLIEKYGLAEDWNELLRRGLLQTSPWR